MADCEFLGLLAQFYRLLWRDTEILGLILQPVGESGGHLAGIHKVEPEDVFLAVVVYMEGIPIIGGIGDHLAAVHFLPCRRCLEWLPDQQKDGEE